MVRALTRSILVVAVMAALLVSAGGAYAQGTPTAPTIESVAVTSDPGEDGGYAIDDEIQVGLTFSEAVTVIGAPQLTLDVGGQSRTAEYSEGSTTTRLLFTYTVASGDEDTDGIAVVANGLALNGGAIRAGTTDATLTHAALQANDHKVDGVAPTVTVGGETRAYVPPGRQFNVIFYFSEQVYGITTDEITVTNGVAHDVRATLGNDTWPRFTRWDVIIQPAAEGPVTVTLEPGAGADAYGNETAAPDSALEVIAANPVTVEVARTTSGFAEGGRAEFTVTRSRDNGAIPVSLSVAQTGDFLSGAVEVYPPPDPNNPDEPVTPQAVTFTQTPFNLNVTFAAGETSKRIALLTEDDFSVEDDGTVTLSVPAQPDQYKYIPGHASSASADVRDNDESATVSLYWSRSFHPYTLATLNTEQEGGSVTLVVYGRATGQSLLVTLAVTEVGSYLELDGARAWGYENLGNGQLQVTVPAGSSFQNVVIPLLENDVKEADGSVTITVEPDPGLSYIPRPGFGALTVPVKDNDTPSTVSISAPDDLTEGAQLTYTLTRTWAPGQSRGELPVNVRLAQTGNYITWPGGNEPGDDGLVTIPVTFAARSLTATFTLETVDDEVSEVHGSVTATILADAGGSYVTGADSDHATRLLDNDLPIISVTAVATQVTEGTAAQFRLSRMGNTSVATRVGLWVGGLPKIMTDATEATALTADNADLTERLSVHGAWVDYILDFAAGESEKTLSFTTEADNVNEGDGWLGVTIVQRLGNRFNIGTGYAQVHVDDDDIPTVSISQVTLPTGAATLEGDIWVGDVDEGLAVSWVVSCSGNYEYSPISRSFSGLPVHVEQLLLANHPGYYWENNPRLGNNELGFLAGGFCDGQARTHGGERRVVGPDGGVETFKLVPINRNPPIVAQYREAYRLAKAAADTAGTLITQHDIISEQWVTPPHAVLIACQLEPRYCPQYRVGTPHTIKLTLFNRNPVILIKAESTTVAEGEPARFIVQRLWHDDLLIHPDSRSETVVALRASQNGQFITGALPTEITFGQNEISKTIALATVDDSAFSANGSVTIELLTDTTGADLNITGKYETSEQWGGHTPEGGRSDRATIAITNNDDKPGITIAPASGPEGDSGSADMTFTVTLATAVTEAVTVNYATSDGTAIAGQDYTAVSDGSVTIAAGKTTAEFTVSMTGDETDELDETFNVTISMPEPEPNLNGGSSGEPAAAIAGGDTATVAGTILDDDPAVVTVAPKVDTVEEGEMAVFVLTRAGVMDGALAVQVRHLAPGRAQTLDATFEPGAATTEIAVATQNNHLVDYPSVRDYTIEVLGDGAPLDRDDRIFTPGDPATATVKVTDDEELINVTVYAVEAVASWANGAEFRFTRDGDITDPLRIGIWSFLHRPGEGETWGFRFETFEAGQDELVVGQGGFYYPEFTPQQAAPLYPLTLTYTVFGDGGWYGLHRVYQGGDPSSAIVAVQYEGFERALVVGSDAPLWVTVGQTVRIPLTVTNTGSLDSLTSIDITSQHYSDGTNEPRLACQIDGPIADGESKSCEASFLVQETDLKSNNAIIRLDVTATDGQTTSKASRIYMRVRNGVSVGFNDTTKLSVTEPVFGEDNAEATLMVTRVGQSAEEVEVAYTLEPSPSTNRPYPPVEGVDYADNSDTPGFITFGANETKQTITIDILGDQMDEPREQFRVTLVPPEGVLVEDDKRTRTVVITDAAPPTGESYLPTASLLLVSSNPVPENEGPVEFAVVLDREWGKDGQYEVDLILDQLTATPGLAERGIKGDFEEPGAIFLRIPAGQTRFEFSIPLYDDDVREEDETFQLQLGSSHAEFFRTIGASYRALVTIADDDPIPPTEVTLSLSRHGRALASVDEGSSRRDITVTASFPRIHWQEDAADAPLHPADPRDVDTTVRVQFDPDSGATHAAGLDDFAPLKVEDDQGAFVGVESFDIVIPAGQTSGTATLRFKTVNDDVDEEDETVTLMGSEVVAGGSRDSLPVRPASFTLIDDDTRGITLFPGSVAVGLSLVEGGGPGTYSLVLDSQPTGTVVITVAGNQGGFLRAVPDTLTFATSGWDTPQTVSVMALDDGIAGGVPPTAFITHQVSGGDYGSVTVPDIQAFIEDTTKAFVYLEDGQASESGGHVEFTVTVRPTLRTTPVLVRYTTVDGTARAGSDYTRQVETGQTYKILSIPGGQSSATIRIPITDDQVYESADETFTLQLTNHNNKATLDGDATTLTATGTIVEDDPKPVLSVAGPAGEVSYVSENVKDPVTFTLTLVGQSAGDVTVDYATGEAGLPGLLTARQGVAGATEGEDYASTSGTVTFTSGQTTRTVAVPVTNDDVSEETEFFGLKISAPQGADLTDQRSADVANVGLLDDDPPGVTIRLTSIGLDEPASGETAVAGSYTVNLRSQPTDTVTVTIGGTDPAVSLSGNTLTNNQLTFTTTNWNTAQLVTVTPVKDDNAVSETITLTHTLSGGDYTGIAADSVTVNLTDSDTRDLILSGQSLTVLEGDTDGVAYTVKLATQPSDTVTVTISGHGGADLTLSGTTLTNNQLTFTTTNWNTVQTITVQAGDDNDTANESETLTHTAVGGDYVNVSRDLPVTITDDDFPDVKVSFGAMSYTVAEGDPVSVTVSLDLAPKREVTVPIRRTNQGASDSDYTGVPASVTFSPTETEQTFDFTAADDDEDDDGERVLLGFGTSLPEGVSAGTQATTTVSITDDDDPRVTVQFEQGAYSVAEGDPVTVTVTLSADPERQLVIPIATEDLRGAGSTDYSGVPRSVTFNSGDTSETFVFTAAHDDEDDDGERVRLSFGSMPDARVNAGTPATTTVSITDDDDPQVTVQFEQGAYSVAEGDPITVTVTLSADPERQLVIPIATEDLRGAGSTDYSGVPRSVTFNSGDTSKTFVFTAAHDDEDDDGERVRLSFGTSLPEGVSAGTQATTTVSITDDDDPRVTVQFEQGAYSVAEGDPITVTVTLSADPERQLVIPIATEDLRGAGSTDYSGVPRSVTFNSGDTSETFVFTAAQDDEDDDGERVRLSFGSMPDARVNAGTPATTTVSITDDDPPTAANGTVTASEDTPYAFAAARFGYVDDDGDVLSSVKITGLPTAGTLKLDGTTIASGALPKAVAAADLAGGKLTYTPPANANGAGYASFTFKVNDGTADSALTYTMTINVTAVNDAPTASPGTVTTREDTPYAFAAARFGYADIDGDTLSSVKVTALPTAGTLKLDGTPIASGALPKAVAAADLAAGKLTYTPPPNANKTAYASFTFKVNDGTVDSAQYTMTIDVTAVNDAATGAPTISGAAEVGQILTASTANISDVDGVPNLFIYRWIRYAANGTTFESNIGGDARTYTLTESEEGKKVKVEVRFRDNGGSAEGPLLSAAYPASLSQTVAARPLVNTLPTAANGTVTTNEDTAHTFSAAQFSYADTDGDVLSSVKITALPTAGTLKLDGTPIASGALPKAVAADDLAAGKLTYTPPANANGAGYASFTFKVNDGTADSALTYTMTINVTAVNDAPTASPGTVTTREDTPYAFAAARFGYADIDGDALSSVKIIALPTAGTLKLDGTPIASGALPKTVAAADLAAGKLTYTPPPNANKTAYASFTFKVNDGTVDSALTYTMTIDVTAVNDAATGAPTISGAAEVGQTLTASTAGISDVDGVPNSFTYQWKRYAANGTTFEANIGGDARTYTLTESEEGKKVKVDVRFRDNGGSAEGPLLSAAYPASLSETVGARPLVNTLPTAANGTVTTNEDTAHTFLAAEFSYADTDGDALSSVKITGLPTAGTLKLDGTPIASGALPKAVAAADLAGGKLTYTPPANANGAGYASFTFKVNDGTADSAQYTITINVTAVNDAPTASAGTVTTNEDTDHTFLAAQFSYADIDGGPLSSVKVTALPTAGTLKLDGTPIASGALPKAVAAADLAAGKLTYTPPPNANKTAYASFTFKVNDGTVDSALTYTMTINVTPVNDAATGAPTISGAAEVGQILTASTANISDVDGVPNLFIYRWIRYAANGTTFESNIGGDARRYTLTASEEGKKVKVEVRFRDNGGSAEGPLLSAAYPASLSQTVAARPLVNTLPTAANGTVTTNEDTAHTFSAAQFSYADEDDDVLSSVKITALPTAGTLKLDGTPIASGALPKAVAAADLAAGKLTYTPPANANGAGYASFTFKVNDGTADSALTYTMTINVTPVNDAPTASPGTVTTNEDTDYTFAAARFGYADIDDDTLSSVKITALPTAGTLKLDGTPIASGALPKAVAAADLAAGKLTYTPPPNANKTAYASFTFKVNDGTVDSAQYTITINVTPVNDAATGAPTISGAAEVGQILTASTANISDVDGVPNLFIYRWIRYAANGTTFESNIGGDARRYTLTASEEGKKVKVEVRFRDNGGSAEGPLLSAAYPASLSQTVAARPLVNTLPTAANGTVTTNEDTAHTFSAAQFSYADEDDDVLSSVKITALPTAGTLKLDGTTIASGALPKAVAAADLAAGKLTYTPPANANKTAYASFTFKVNDGTADSAQYTITINVTPVNDAPTASPGTVTTNEDTDYTFAAARFGYADIDDDTLSSVKITALPTAGTLKLDGTPIASGALPKAVAAADLAAGKLTYTPPPNANKTAYASFTFKVNDGTVDSAQYTITINVTPVNDAATGAPTISGAAEVGQILTASTANISDVDGVPNLFIYRWIRYAANGTTFESNIGGDARRYTLTASEEGKKVKVEVRFRDNGGSAEGPLLSAAYPASLSQTVAARPLVNTLPTAANGTVTTNEDTAHTFSAAQFSYADEDDDVLSSVKITALPTAGTLKLDGTTIASGALPKAVAAADLAAGKLTYTPPPNANKTAYASFTFKVNDGTADSAQYTITINVTPVNDAATGAPTISGTAYVGETLTASAAGITDVEGVPGSLDYQWIQVGADGASNPTDIGADASTYTLTEADFSKRIKVRVDFIDGQGSSESRTSAAYPANGTVQRMTVQFQESAYSVAEGDMVMVTVALNVAAQHVIDIPIAKEELGGAGSTDYSGVPPSVTFNAGDASKSFEFTAARDAADDDGESVKVKFGPSLPLGVSPGARAETVVSIASRAAQQISDNVGQSGTVVTITQVPEGTVEDASTFIEGTRALFRLEFEAVGGGPSPGGVDVDLSFDWQNVSPLVNGHGQATKATISVPRVDVWDTWVQIRDNDIGQPDETMTIRITGCRRSGCIIGTPSAVTLNIVDDDGGPPASIPGPPPSPRLVCARSGSGYDNTGIAVSWKAPNFVGGAPVESYELRYKESSQFVGGRLIEHAWVSWPHGVAATSATITGLVPRTEYTVQVSAVNGNGPGLWSEPWYFGVGPTDEICEIIDLLTP